MTYSQIFKDIYWDHKRFIKAYVIFSIIMSILLIGIEGISLAVGTGTVVKTLGGSFGATIAPIMGASLMMGIDPPSGGLIMSIVSLIVEYTPADVVESAGNAVGVSELSTISHYSFGLFDFNAVRIFCLIWFIVSKIPKSTRVTLPFGLTFEDIENKMGGIVVIAVVVVQFIKFIPLGEDNVVNAASFEGAGEVVSNGLNALTAFIVMICFLIRYAVLRLSGFFMDIVILPITGSTPGVAVFAEVMKTILVAGLCVAYFKAPYLFYFLFAFFVLIAAVLFKSAYLAVRYFKAIVAKPLWHKIRSKITKKPVDAPLVPAKLPKRAVKAFGGKTPELFVPVFLLRTIFGNSNTRKRDLWYLVKDDEGIAIVKLKRVGKSIRINIQDKPELRMYIHKGIMYIEFFNIWKGEENIGRLKGLIRKNISFALSLDYSERYEEIKAMLGYVDYAEHKAAIKEKLKAERKANHVSLWDRIRFKKDSENEAPDGA